MRFKVNRLLEIMVFKFDKNVDKIIFIFIRLASDLCRILEECVIKVLIY
jgi:hypothetical protein